MLSFSQRDAPRARPMAWSHRSFSRAGAVGALRRAEAAGLPGTAEAGSTRGAPCSCGGGCPTCVAKKMLAEQTESAPATAATAPLAAAPANVIQRKPLAGAAQSMQLGPGVTADMSPASGGAQDSTGGNGAEQESFWHWLSQKMCPPNKVTYLGSVDSRFSYRIEAGQIMCTVYVDYAPSDTGANDMLDKLDKAGSDAGSVCIDFESNFGDPDCKEPRKVYDVATKK